jgi:23S rRNA (pseudouridine1915-N3)-methyltransferase
MQEIEISESARRSVDERRNEEASELLNRLPNGALLIALDEKGSQLDSSAFAKRLAKYRDEGMRDIAFAIGGADGHGPALLSAASMRLALGPLTLPHGLARIVLTEQLYRAATILAGHPYHRD